MKGALSTTVARTPLDGENGALGPKRLAIVVAIIIVVGAAVIFIGQWMLASQDTWEATVVGVTPYTVSFTREEGSDDTDVASYPEDMQIEVGDRVLIKTDVETGNEVIEVIDGD